MQRSKAPSQLAKRAKTSYQRNAYKPQKGRSSYGRFPRRSLGFPEKLSIRHKYVEHLQLSSGSGIQATHQYRANGMYDPDYTTLGHYPMYFNNCKAIYDHYTVWESYIKVTFVCRRESEPAVCNIYLNDDATVMPGNMNALVEQSSSVSGICTSDQPLILIKKFNARRVYGGSVLANDNLQGTPTTDPAELSFYTISIAGADLLADVVVCAKVEIVYSAIWDELKDQPMQ